MKLLITSLIITIALFPAIALSEYYSMHGIILSDMEGITTILGDDGNEWTIASEPDLWEGDRVFMVMDDNSTPEDPTDDRVLINWYDPA